MSTASDLHVEAMELTDRALAARHAGAEEQARELFRQAYAKEVLGIEALKEDDLRGTWYSILHRSAANLALQGNLPRDAERVVARILAGEPHPAIAPELRDVWEQALSMQRFPIAVSEPASYEMNMVFSGDAVGNGFAQASEVLDRIQNSEKLVQRIIQRRLGKPYKSTVEAAARNYGLRMAVPKAGSFAVGLRLEPRLEPPKEARIDSGEIIGEFIDLMDMLNQNRLGDIQKRIPDTGYFTNLLALGRTIMPDGIRIAQVSIFSEGGNGARRATTLVRPSYEIPLSSDVEMMEPAETLIIGRLRYVNGLKPNTIKVVDDAGISHKLAVSSEQLEGIGSYWAQRVVVTGTYDGRDMVLDNIQLNED